MVLTSHENDTMVQRGMTAEAFLMEPGFFFSCFPWRDGICDWINPKICDRLLNGVFKPMDQKIFA